MNQGDIQVQEISNSPGLSQIKVFFPKDSSYFAGHFPDVPLLPGVIQVNLAIELFEKFQNRKLTFGGFKNIKFFSPIFPNRWLKLECALEADKNQMRFSYSDDERPYCKGVVVVNND